MRRSWMALPLIGWTLALPAAAGATVIDVTTTADAYGLDGKCSLREAVLTASGNPIPLGPGQCPTGSTIDTINLPAGTYELTDAGSSGELYFMQTVNLVGAGAGRTVIEQQLPHRVLHVFAGAQLELSGVTVTGGHPAGPGGGIFNEGDLTVRASAILGNRAGDGAPGGDASGNGGAGGGTGDPGFDGGGIASTGGSLVVMDSVIAGNRAGDGGRGGNGTATAPPAGFDGAAATGGAGAHGGTGGGVSAVVDSSANVVQRSWVHDNRAGNGGAGGTGTGGPGGDAGLTAGFAGGAGTGGTGGAGGHGGGLAGVAVDRSTVNGNASGAGGDGGAGTGGRGSSAGLKGGNGGLGANAIGGAGGTGGSGAGLWEARSVVNSTVATNHVSRQGAGGSATAGGGGAGSDGNAIGNGGNGGNGGSAFGGSAGLPGSGSVYRFEHLERGAGLSLTTVSGNTVAAPPAAATATAGSGGKAGRAGTGGGTNGTPGVAGSATQGAAGIAGIGGVVGGDAGNKIVLEGAIVAGNDGNQCLGQIQTLASTITFGAAACDGGLVADPKLGPLEDHGGPAPVLAPAAGSPAIDPADESCRPTDERGVKRPAGAGCDAGAYEATPPAAVTGAASDVAATNATLAGAVTPMGRATSYIEFGPTTAYGRRAGEAVRVGLAAIALSLPVTGLTPTTTYHYRVVASSAYGTATGEDRTFRTPTPPLDVPPSITGASIAPKRFTARRSATVRLTLSEPAALKLVVSRAAAGRKVKGRCRKPTRANRAKRRCTRWVKRRTLTPAGVAGANAVKLPGAGLRPGRHRVVIFATDAAGHRSAKVVLRFKIRR